MNTPNQTPASSFLSRRSFLNRTGAALAGATLAAGMPYPGTSLGAETKRSGKIPVGLQLYSIREQCAKDLPGMLRAVAKIGYKGVEFAGYHGKTAKELRTLLDDNGLVCCGTHTPYESILESKLQETIEFNKTLGNKFLIVPWMEGKTKQDWEAKARLFNEVATKAKAAGQLVGYHAHAHDFEKLEGVSAWDIFFGGTRPEVVMQLDTSNCREGGADPVQVLHKYPGRATTIHLKAWGGGSEAVIGEDKIAWKDVFDFCEGPGRTEWYIVEHESGKDPLDAVRRCFEGLKKLGKV